jgi:drug/metabolite transporter (DMT)-like permease
MVFALPVGVFAWGSVGHRVTGEAAARRLPTAMPAFVRNAAKQLGYLNPEPDGGRDRAESTIDQALDGGTFPEHFIDMEMASSTVLAAGIGDSIFFECARVLGLGRAMTLAMIYPLMAAAFAAAFLGEPITLRSAAGAVTTLAGLGLIVTARSDAGGTHEGQRRAVLLSFVVALTWAASAIIMKPAMRELSPLTAQGVRLPLVAAFLWLMPWSRAGVPRLLAAGRPVVTPLTVLTALTAISSMTWIAGLKYSDVVVATVLSSTSPMFALGLGAMFLGERLSPAAVLGALLTIAGIVVLDI